MAQSSYLLQVIEKGHMSIIRILLAVIGHLHVQEALLLIICISTTAFSSLKTTITTDMQVSPFVLYTLEID